MKAAPWRLQQDSLILNCHVQPGAKQNRIIGVHDQKLKIQLTAPPVDGKANAMLIDYLAQLFTRPRSQICIKHGFGSRQKTIQINGIAEIPEKLSEFAGR